MAPYILHVRSRSDDCFTNIRRNVSHPVVWLPVANGTERPLASYVLIKRCMHSVMGVFQTWDVAERAANSLGLAEDRLSIIASDRREPPETGIGAPLGGAVGAAVGAASGSALGTAAASLLVPGVGPVIATGVVAALVFGAGGAAVGASAGGNLEAATDVQPPPRDASFAEDALRRGRVIVVALTDNEDNAETIRRMLMREGAESVGSPGRV